MSARTLWAISVPLAIVGWAGLAVTTAVLPPSLASAALALFLLALAIAFTVAPLAGFLGARLHWGDLDRRPQRAIRLGVWAGLWTAACVALRTVDRLSPIIALALAVILALVEGFLSQRGGGPQDGVKRPAGGAPTKSP
jgi:hypothetical protein